jgi:hypothetical protein
MSKRLVWAYSGGSAAALDNSAAHASSSDFADFKLNLQQ